MTDSPNPTATFIVANQNVMITYHVSDSKAQRQSLNDAKLRFYCENKTITFSAEYAKNKKIIEQLLFLFPKSYKYMRDEFMDSGLISRVFLILDSKPFVHIFIDCALPGWKISSTQEGLTLSTLFGKTNALTIDEAVSILITWLFKFPNGKQKPIARVLEPRSTFGANKLDSKTGSTALEKLEKILAEKTALLIDVSKKRLTPDKKDLASATLEFDALKSQINEIKERIVSIKASKQEQERVAAQAIAEAEAKAAADAKAEAEINAAEMKKRLQETINDLATLLVISEAEARKMLLQPIAQSGSRGVATVATTTVPTIPGRSFAEMIALQEENPELWILYKDCSYNGRNCKNGNKCHFLHSNDAKFTSKKMSDGSVMWKEEKTGNIKCW